MGWRGQAAKVAFLIVIIAVVVELLTDEKTSMDNRGFYGVLMNLLGLLLPGNKKGLCNRLGSYIFALPEHERTAMQTRIANLGGFTLAARAMRQHLDDPEVCRECAYFFCAMANFNRASSLIAGRSDAVPALVEAMHRHPQNSVFQAQASASMGCWCDWTPETEARSAELGGPQAILKALETFPADAHVQFLGWAGLSSNSNRLDSKKLIIQAGALETGIRIVRDPVLQKGFRVRQEIIMTFNNLAANCNECCSAIMGLGDIIPQVITAMVEEVPDAERGTKADGIQLMGTLSQHNKTTRAAVMESGFLPHALEAMHKFAARHPQNAWPLAEFGLTLIRHLSEDDPEAQEKLKKAGAVDAIRAVMTREPSSPERQGVGRLLLNRFGA